MQPAANALFLVLAAFEIGVDKTIDTARSTRQYVERDEPGARCVTYCLTCWLGGGPVSPWLWHTSAITPALSPTALDAVHKSIEICRASDTLVSVDLNFRRALWSEKEARGEFRFLASKADIVFATEEEARIACDASDAASLARELASLGGGKAVVKRGELGAVAYIQGQVHVVEAVPVVAVDSVGAGDAFAGGFLAALIRGGDSSESLRWAALMGAWSVATRGDWQGLPTPDELETLQDSSDDVTR